jgi:DNA replication protein DnaC
MMATELFYRNLPRVRSASWWRAATAVRAIFGGLGEDEARRANDQVFRSELLVLDEIGRGHEGRAWGLIIEIVSDRYDHQLPTIVTTNRRLRAEAGDKEKGLSEEDPALYRRLKEGFIGGFIEPWKLPVKA